MRLVIFTEPQEGASSHDLLRVAQLAESAGFDGFFRSDHYLAIFGGGGPGPTDAWVTLGGPDHGTQTAYACLQTSCQQMWPNSTFLKSLNAVDETPGTPRFGTWWSACDEVINPHTSVVLSGGATNTQTACLRHSQLHEDATVYAQVRDFVKPPLLASIAR